MRMAHSRAFKDFLVSLEKEEDFKENYGISLTDRLAGLVRLQNSGAKLASRIDRLTDEIVRRSLLNPIIL